MKIRKHKPLRLGKWWEGWQARWREYNLRWQVIALGLLTATFSALIVGVEIPPQSVRLGFGEVAPQDILAPRSTYVIDLRATIERQREAELLVLPVYDVSPHVLEEAQTRVRETFAAIRAARESPVLPAPEHLAATIKARSGITLNEQTIHQVLAARHEQLAGVEKAILSAVRNVFEQGIRSNTRDLELAHDTLRRRMQEARIPPSLRGFATEVALSVVREPNFIYNREETERRRRAKREAVEPVRRRIEARQVIIRAGQRLTQEDVDMLAALGLQGPRINPQRTAALFLLSLLFVSVSGLYLRRYATRVFKSDSSMLLISLLVLFALIAFKVAAQFPGVDYLAVPLTATVGMIVSIMLDAGAAVMVAVTVAVLASTLCSDGFSILVMALGSSLFAIRCVADLHSRAQLTRTAFLLGCANVVLSATVGALTKNPTPDMLIEMSWGFGSGIACAILTLGLVMFLERPFGITSHLRLLELSDPNEPLLKRLQLEAPGTCTHSIMVGNLAENAAKAIGADALFTRVASLYHDIGKIKRPYCFAENQFSADNIHDRLTPSLSALAIIAHVKEGIEMAREYKLPQAIIDIIPQHHGTNLVTFFYSRALENQSEGEINEASFRYPGPKPQTKEAGIIMLADGVEATTRSLANPTPARIEALVKRIFRERLEDGQLAECDLTLRELQVIEKTFVHLLKGLLHTRVEYPGQDHGIPTIPLDVSRPRRKGGTGSARVSPHARGEKGNGSETPTASHLRRIAGRGN